MNVDIMRELLLGALEQSPSLILDLHEPPFRQPGGYHPPEGTESPDWCMCNHCREMPTADERLCCQKAPEHCVSLLPVCVLC